MILLITGSRNASAEMIANAKVAVRRAHELKWLICVGDANGIDAAVIQEADTIGASLLVYGANNVLRNKSKVAENNRTMPVNYYARDDFMVAAADKVYAIWDGKSQGTLRNYKNAKLLEKECWLKQF
jgi:hypothetical protein